MTAPEVLKVSPSIHYHPDYINVSLNESDEVQQIDSHSDNLMLHLFLCIFGIGIITGAFYLVYHWNQERQNTEKDKIIVKLSPQPLDPSAIKVFKEVSLEKLKKFENVIELINKLPEDHRNLILNCLYNKGNFSPAEVATILINLDSEIYDKSTVIDGSDMETQFHLLVDLLRREDISTKLFGSLEQRKGNVFFQNATSEQLKIIELWLKLNSPPDSIFHKFFMDGDKVDEISTALPVNEVIESYLLKCSKIIAHLSYPLPEEAQINLLSKLSPFLFVKPFSLVELDKNIDKLRKHPIQINLKSLSPKQITTSTHVLDGICKITFHVNNTTKEVHIEVADIPEPKPPRVAHIPEPKPPSLTTKVVAVSAKIITRSGSWLVSSAKSAYRRWYPKTPDPTAPEEAPLAIQSTPKAALAVTDKVASLSLESKSPLTIITDETGQPSENSLTVSGIPDTPPPPYSASPSLKIETKAAVAESSSPILNYTLTTSEADNINFIITNSTCIDIKEDGMLEKGIKLKNLKSNAQKLSDAGALVGHLHPLVFLASLISKHKNLFKRLINYSINGFPYTAIYRGFMIEIEVEINKQKVKKLGLLKQLEPIVKGEQEDMMKEFAKEVGIKYELLRPAFKKGNWDWNQFIKILDENIA